MVENIDSIFIICKCKFLSYLCSYIDQLCKENHIENRYANLKNVSLKVRTVLCSYDIAAIVPILMFNNYI